MKEFGCYILFSQKLNKFYTGACQKSLNERIQKHNSSFYGKNKYTSTTNDWELFLFITSQNYAHAIRLERKIKRMKSKVYIQNLKKYPELIDKILKETDPS